MKILALDTSGTPAMVAAITVSEDNQIESGVVRDMTESRRLSRDIVLSIDGALRDAGWTLDDVEAIAVGLGPGSWTGLRIGLTTAKTLAQTRELPLIGVPTFDALAGVAQKSMSLIEGCFIVAAARCRPGEIYTKIWQVSNGKREVLHSESIAPPATVINWLNAAQSQWPIFLAFQDDGQASADIQALGSGLQWQADWIVCDCSTQGIACSMAQIAATPVREGVRDDPLTLSPLYLAPSSAERVRAEKMARENAP